MTKSQPILNPKTKTILLGIIKDPTNSLAIIGPNGIGKTTVAEWIIQQITKEEDLELSSHPKVKLITSENNNSISIEQVHSINEFMKLKTPGTEIFRRFVVIEHGDQMTIPAQNSLLRLLEEPSSDTMIILTIENPQTILPTVLSRLQPVTILPPTKINQKDYFKLTTETFDRYFLLSGGLPGLIQTIIDNPDSHPLVNALDQAREMLGKKTFDRLVIANKLASDKDEVKNFIEVLYRMSKVSISSAAEKNDQKRADRWLKIQAATLRAKNALGKNANTKLVLSDLVLNLV